MSKDWLCFLYPSRPPLTRSRRQLKTTHRPLPPAELKAHLTQATFTKAQKYARDKLYFSFAKTLYSWLVTFVFLRYNTYAWAWDLSARWMDAFGMKQSRVVSCGALGGGGEQLSTTHREILATVDTITPSPC